MFFYFVEEKVPLTAFSRHLSRKGARFMSYFLLEKG